MTLLSICALSKSFDGVDALDDVSFGVSEGEIVGLIGPNGAGKTTCFNVVTGFEKPSSGSVEFAGIGVTGWPPHRLTQLGMVRTFQQTAIFPRLSVFENVLCATARLASVDPWGAVFRTSRHRGREQELSDRAREMIAVMGLDAQMNRDASALAYGDQRRLGVAIALATAPRLLLIDEPAAGLNPAEAVAMVETLRRVRDREVTIMIVEHDMRVVMNLCDRIIVLNHGRKVAEGRPAEIRANEEVIRVYLGRSKGGRHTVEDTTHA